MEASATTILARGFQLLSTWQLKAALTAFDDAQELGADADECAGGRWRTFMLLGDMEAAWREADAIRSRGNPDPHRVWDGSSLDGKRVIVRCLHGFGDTIQMIRFVPQLMSMASFVILEVQPRLIPLLSHLPFLKRERLQVSTWGEHAEFHTPPWDIQIEIMEVPYALRVTRAELPANACYLQVAKSEIARVQEEMGPELVPRVGLVWTAGKWNPDRAIPFQQLRPLLRSPAEFWSLVDPEDYAELGPSAAAFPIRDAGRLGAGISGLTATIAALDLLITTDTLAAHLAGAMGVPVWVLLPYCADWRWMQEDEPPWYPSMLLFRQPKLGDWLDVVSRVDAKLQPFLLGESSHGKVFPRGIK